MITNLTDLAAHVCAHKPEIQAVARSVYKYTSCGASINEVPGGVSVSSIVEGAEACTPVHALLYPFTGEAWDGAVQAVEDEAKEIWDNTHGCDDCGPEEWDGSRPINPNCKSCKGEGAII